MPMLTAGVVDERGLDRTEAAGKHFADFLDRAGLRERDELVKLGLLRGAMHQTGWTGLVADVIRRRHGDVPSVGDLLRTLRDAKDES